VARHKGNSQKVLSAVMPPKGGKSNRGGGSSRGGGGGGGGNRGRAGPTSGGINPAMAQAAHPGRVGAGRGQGKGHGSSKFNLKDFLGGKPTTTTVKTHRTHLQKQLDKLAGREAKKYLRASDSKLKLHGDTVADFTAPQKAGQEMALAAAKGPQQAIADAATKSSTDLLKGGATDPTKATSPTAKFLLQDVLDPSKNVTSKALTDPLITGKGKLPPGAPAPAGPGAVNIPRSALQSGQLPGDVPRGPAGGGAPGAPGGAPGGAPAPGGGVAPGMSTGDFLTRGALDPANNPALQSYMAAATRPISENLLYNVLPNVRSGAAGAGQYGSSRQGIAEALAANKAFQEMGDVSANIANQGYQTGLGVAGQTYGNQLNTALGARGQDVNAELTGRGQDVQSRGQTLDYLTGQRTQDVAARGQDVGAATDVYKTGVGAAGTAYGQGLDATTRALGLAPSTQGAAVQPAVTTSGVGEVQQGQNQAETTGANYKNIYNANVPLQKAQAGLNLSGAAGGGSTTTTSEGDTGLLQGAVGGALTGAKLGSLIPGLGPAVGAGAGAAGGSFLSFL
jgi:hypothetical protein